MRPEGGEEATEDALCHLDTSGLTVRHSSSSGSTSMVQTGHFFLWLESLTLSASHLSL